MDHMVKEVQICILGSCFSLILYSTLGCGQCPPSAIKFRLIADVLGDSGIKSKHLDKISNKEVFSNQITSHVLNRQMPANLNKGLICISS